MPVLFLFLLFFFPSRVPATNGYLAHGYGAPSKSMAGAGTALALDGMDAASNPATMVYVGNRLDLGAALFSPGRGYRAAIRETSDSGPETMQEESGDDYFVMPHMAWNLMLDDASSLGVTLGVNGGMRTEYDLNPFTVSGGGSSPAGIDFVQSSLGITYARKISARHSFGITPVLSMNCLEVKGLEAFRFFSREPGRLTNNGHDYAYGGGLRLGWHTRLSDTVGAGISYQTRLWMTRFEEYEGLLAGHGDLDTPPNLNLGLAWRPISSLTLVFDLQYIFYEDIEAISNPGRLSFEEHESRLGDDDGPGFGWRNLTVCKFGAQWDCLPDLTIRAGYSKSNQVLPSSQTFLNILTPAVVREHFTCGLTKRLAETDVNLSFMFAPKVEVDGEITGSAFQAVELYMQQYEVECSLTYHF